MEPSQDRTGKKQENTGTGIVFKLAVVGGILATLLLIVIAGLLAALYVFSKAPEAATKTVREVRKEVMLTLDEGAAVLNKHFGTKVAMNTLLGPLVNEERFRRLQFFQRDQVCLFRIVAYRGSDRVQRFHTQYYKMESDKTPISDLAISMSQYCVYEAKGTYEFNFYIDMSDLSKWSHDWNSDEFTLTLYPPDINADTPAELEPLVFTCIADSVSINEGTTKKKLEESISELKRQLAEDQKKFMYHEAKIAIEEHYNGFIKQLIPNSPRYPKIKVVFPHEKAPVTEATASPKL